MAIIFTIKITESLAHNWRALYDAPIIELDVIDSTNNYAMRLIDADTAQEGLTIVTGEQTQGKGQRGRRWEDTAGDSLLMSVILSPKIPLEKQFAFNATVATAFASVLADLYEQWDVKIKWPNDIIINDKKAGGILIENVLRGRQWSYAIVGFGLNLYQPHFPENLPFATSLQIASGKRFDRIALLQDFRKRLFQLLAEGIEEQPAMDRYNEFLYRLQEEQQFSDGEKDWKARVLEVLTDGTLLVLETSGIQKAYTHGSVIWKWK